jgi:hypothetical protein
LGWIYSRESVLGSTVSAVYNNQVLEVTREEATVAELLAQYPHLASERYDSVRASDFNRVLLGDQFVAKTRHDGSSKGTMFETYIVAALHDCDSPLIIPRFITSDAITPPYYSAVTRVPGEILGPERIRQLSEKEKQSFGEQTGTFVAWLEANLSRATYKEIIDVTGHEVPHRKNFIESMIHPRFGFEDRDPEFIYVAYDVYDKYKELDRIGLLQPSLIGHDDLRTDNITFERQDGQWRMKGVFDFDLTKPSTPEQELRHIAPLGRVALDAAIAAYEARNPSRSLARSLIGFWALAQATTVYYHASLDAARIAAYRDMNYLLSEIRRGYFQ